MGRGVKTLRYSCYNCKNISVYGDKLQCVIYPNITFWLMYFSAEEEEEERLKAIKKAKECSLFEQRLHPIADKENLAELLQHKECSTDNSTILRRYENKQEQD